jgi:heme exporter protein A
METIEMSEARQTSVLRRQASGRGLHGVSRFFEHRAALVRVDLGLEQGEVLLVRGSNGPGKSTLLKVLATALSPTEGEGRILGLHLRTERNEIRRRVEYVGHATRLYEGLTARENLAFVSKLWALRKPRIDEGLERVCLQEVGRARPVTQSIEEEFA